VEVVAEKVTHEAPTASGAQEEEKKLFLTRYVLYAKITFLRANLLSSR
jgi:hypothetical protein